MAKNILLTSLSAAERRLPPKYYALRKEFGFDYCEAFLDAEAGIKAILAKHQIDEIIVIGADGSSEKEDTLEPVSIKEGRKLYSKDTASLSTYGLLQYRLAKHADEMYSGLKEAEELLPLEDREKLIRFVQDFQEKSPYLKNIKDNRLFDALAQNDKEYNAFWDGFFEAFPELREKSAACVRWTKAYLYSLLKPSAKLELLPVNEKTRIRCISEDGMGDSRERAAYMMSLQQNIAGDSEKIDLYVSLNGDDAADTFIVINMLDILVSMPSGQVSLKRLNTVRDLKRRMTGAIRDDTEGFGVTELFHGIQAFLNYGKADIIKHIWEKSGENNEGIASMIYAMRRVDVGLSMCNIPEVENGILRLRKLFRDEKFWQESSRYGVFCNVIAESIRQDYGALLEGSGRIPFIEMVKWAYRHQFYQQTLTLIETNAPENLVRSGIFYYCGDEKEEGHVISLLAEQRMELKPYEYYKMDDIDHYFIKNYDRGRRGKGAKGEDQQKTFASLRVSSLENKDASLITGFTACDSRETLKNVLYAYYHIGEVRNKISHADAAAMAEKRLIVDESDEISALDWLKESIDFFIISYEKAMAEVQDKKPQVILITGNDVRSEAERMKREKQKNDR